jgi:hypothetical protein
MRPVAAAALSVVCAALGGGLAACFDLFHGTAGLVTACEIDASSPGCAAEAGAPSLCASSAAEATDRARHACAWLGACDGPTGKNAFGSCMFEALMAYDCEANPAHRAKGKAASLWACMAGAKDCGQVSSCVSGGVDACAGPGGCLPDPAAACPPRGCYSGSIIHWCVNGGDLGIDCESSGRQACDGFPAADASQWVACLPDGDSGAPCTPGTAVQCDGGVANFCPAGTIESLDCTALLGRATALGDRGGCKVGSLDPPFDWTSACALVPPACEADACDAGALLGCERGAVFSVDCLEAGLGPCSIATDAGARAHAACNTK